MLHHLHIRNYALITALDLDLDAGMSVITGETGAGKSILLGALGLLQGHRADAKAIKAGETKCVVEGTFAAPAGVAKLLEAADVDSDGDEVLIRREISVTGKSRAFINDTPVNLATLKGVSELLIDIHSQHQNLLLSRENFLLDTLDTMANNGQEREQYAHDYQAWRQAVKALKQLQETAERDAADEEFMAFQLQQLTEAQLREGEQEALEEENEILSHAEEIQTSLYEVTGSLQNDDGDVVAALRRAVRALGEVEQYLPQAQELAARLESARIEIDDVLNDVEREADRVEVNPHRLAAIDERLSTIYSLQKKHQRYTVAELLELTQELQTKLSAIGDYDALLEEAKAATKKAQAALKTSARALTESRQRAATLVEEALVASLQGLGMPHAQIRFEVSPRPRPERSGFDAVAVLFSANKQVPPQDVAQIASGGEIARVMLSLKALLAQQQNLPTIIFDEIDTGVSGVMAERMGQVMQRMGKRTQVICITHLPQIAALGSQHLWVHKQENDTGTSSHIAVLSREQRVEEIAQMLSGENLTEAALANAQELLGQSS